MHEIDRIVEILSCENRGWSWRYSIPRRVRSNSSRQSIKLGSIGFLRIALILWTSTSFGAALQWDTTLETRPGFPYYGLRNFRNTELRKIFFWLISRNLVIESRRKLLHIFRNHGFYFLTERNPKLTEAKIPRKLDTAWTLRNPDFP